MNRDVWGHHSYGGTLPPSRVTSCRCCWSLGSVPVHAVRRVVWDHHSNDLVRNQNLPKLNLQSHVVPDAALLRGDAIQTATPKPTPLFCNTALYSAVSVGAVTRVTPLPHLYPPCTLRSTHRSPDSNCRAVTFVSIHAALLLQVVLEPFCMLGIGAEIFLPYPVPLCTAPGARLHQRKDSRSARHHGH